MFKKEKGITIVTLVVTMVILLILAGVSIVAIFDKTGLLNLSSKSTEKYKDSQQNEDEELKRLSKAIDNGKLPSYPENVEGTEQGTIIKTPIKWTAGASRKVNVATGEESETIEIASVYAVSDGNDNIIPIPYGFYYVGGTKDTGVVISDDEGDKDAYVNFENTEELKEGIPTGVAYNNDGTVNIEHSRLKGNQFVWIPCEVEDYRKNTNFEATPNNWIDWTTLQSEKIQIEKYGGFYVGRYQAGTMWDVIMRFISKEPDYSDLENPSWGNYLDSTLTNCQGRYIMVTANGTSAIQYDSNHEHHHGIMTTGSTEDNKKNNIYDLAGNLYEITQEIMLRNTSLITYVERGCSWINSYKEAKNIITIRQGAGGIGMDSASSFSGFRPILYIK